jgi:hypothetical protein
MLQDKIESRCCLENTYSIIVIECSQTLSHSNKLSSVFLAVLMATTFSMFEISYSIIVFTDFSLHVVIKTFEKTYSIKILQITLDSVMIDRLPLRIAISAIFLN